MFSFCRVSELIAFTVWVILVDWGWAVLTGNFGLFGPDTFLLFPVYYVYNTLVLERLTKLPEDWSLILRGTLQAPRGVLAKRPKPIQEQRVDLPAIGVATVRGAARRSRTGCPPGAARGRRRTSARQPAADRAGRGRGGG